jgi:hypothetical protein
MGFRVRPFQECVAAFAASSAKKKLKKQDGSHWDSKEAHAFKSLGSWPSSPPVTSLYLQDDPLSHSDDVLKDPKQLVEYCNFKAVGTWNARGKARWLASDAPWILADVELTQEQAGDRDEEASGDYIGVVFALWKVEEGYAAAVWDPGERDLLAKVMGLDAWPDAGWQDAEVWYGE